MSYTLHFDAGKYSNKITYGFIVTHNEKIIHTEHGEIQNSTLGVNGAEALSLLKGLEWLLNQGIKNVRVFGDSLLIINQFNGKFNIKASDLKRLHQEINTLKIQFDEISVTWIPRELNHKADRATK